MFSKEIECHLILQAQIISITQPRAHIFKENYPKKKKKKMPP